MIRAFRVLPRLAALALLLAHPAAAQDWTLRPGDEPLTIQAMGDQLIGSDLEYFDGGLSRYSPGGSYSYTYAPENGGGTAFGTYEFRDGGVVCTDFANGFSRCDLFVVNAGRLILITEDGDRFPIRAE